VTRGWIAAATVLAAAGCALQRPPVREALPSLAQARRPCGAYGEDAPIRRTVFEERAWSELSKAIRARGGTIRPSGALDRAARALAAGDLESSRPLARDRVEGALRAAGAFDPSPVAHLVSGPPDEALAALLARVGAGEATHAGVGERQEAGVHHVVVLLSRRRARLDPFPGVVAPGTEATLRGELLGMLHPRAFVTRPDGASEEVPLRGGHAFITTIRFETAGRHQVEIIGTEERGPTVAALLAVSVGDAPCVPEPAQRLQPEPTDPLAGEASVVEAANRTRAAHGLSPLATSRELAAVARAHSERMLAKRTVAHVLGRAGDLADRLGAARIPFRHAYENVASGATALDAHAATEASPAHRANLLSPSASLIGVGVARGALPTGEPVAYLTEILVEPPDDSAGDRMTPDARVREALWRERARRTLPPLTNDLALEAIARDAAAAMRAQDSGEIDGVAAAALAAGRGLAAADAFIARGPEEALRSRNLTDARFRRVGVGVAMGDSRRFGPARLFIAVVYSD
jgi:uncharacterized protein YkwD